ncbi:hypothetical protein SAMN04490357_0980 [Streptomyces misionensis]|uniref:Uncharacterized protein n=1 Tax=Streptomyces misionensis TaxID=67331 RepID=A0A1H4P550_9ACTN|nr:hypothetical protein [Streptomyces misionensis]SEC02052.1 hypothetical protein SAMN04490357_0980 [Streptomyces misionensis]
MTSPNRRNEYSSETEYLIGQSMLPADEARASVDRLLADRLRVIADTLETTNPDRCADFSEGVDWTVNRMRTLADNLDGGAR